MNILRKFSLIGTLLVSITACASVRPSRFGGVSITNLCTPTANAFVFGERAPVLEGINYGGQPRFVTFERSLFGGPETLNMTVQMIGSTGRSMMDMDYVFRVNQQYTWRIYRSGNTCVSQVTAGDPIYNRQGIGTGISLGVGVGRGSARSHGPRAW